VAGGAPEAPTLEDAAAAALLLAEGCTIHPALVCAAAGAGAAAVPAVRLLTSPSPTDKDVCWHAPSPSR